MQENQNKEILDEEVTADETLAENAEVDEETAAAEETAEEKPSPKDKKKAKKTESEIARLEKELAERDAKLAEQNDQYLRVCAEYDNFRKRTAKEREGIRADAYSDAVSSLLPVVDNLERAAAFTEADKVHEGVAMTLRAFAETMEKMGIIVLGTVGETFDPELHNAVMHEENEELPESVITEVFQKGYKMGDKVIRYAMVKVAN